MLTAELPWRLCAKIYDSNTTNHKPQTILMHRIGFKMKLNKGCEAEYEKRHSEIWPDLKNLLKQKSISDYSIFLDRETLNLFASLKISNPKILDELVSEPVMKKWWEYMKDIMETNPDNSPVVIPLEEVFYLH